MLAIILHSLALSLTVSPTALDHGTYGRLHGWVGPSSEEGVPGGQSESGYAYGRDSTVSHSGHASATIRSTTKVAEGWQALTQGIRADRYRGKRIRLSGYIKSKDVSVAAGIWMRVDTVDHEAEFDNSGRNPIKGTHDWKMCSVVLDVPNDAVAIYFGFLLGGTGQGWVDDLKIEVVDPAKLASTGIWMGPDYSKDPKTPANLDFLASPKSSTKLDIPGWMTNADGFSDSIFLDQQVRRNNKPTATLRAVKQSKVDLALFQEIRAEGLRGKRVEFSAYVQTTGKIAGGVMLAIPGGGKWIVAEIPQFVEKGNQWVKDTREWKPVSAVVDVPSWARCLQLGFQLNSQGQLWASDCTFKVVDPKTTSATYSPDSPKIHTKADLQKLSLAPTNMGFEN